MTIKDPAERRSSRLLDTCLFVPPTSNRKVDRSMAPSSSAGSAETPLASRHSATAAEEEPAPAATTRVATVSSARQADRSWIGWVLCTALAGAGYYYWPIIEPQLTALGLLGKPEAPAAPKIRATPVGTSVAETRDMPLYLNGLGTVTALKTVTIRSRVEGEVTRIAFQEGQMVEAGELLAEIDPRPYQVQKEQAEGQLARDAATYEAAVLNETRLKQLFDTKIATKQQLDDQSALVKQLAGVIQADKAQIASAELQLTYCRILAPISGRIGLRLIDEGNMVRPNDVQGMAVITQLQPIALVFTLPQDEIARVQQRFQDAEMLPVEAYDRELKQQLAKGQLTAIDNQVDPTNGTVRLKAEFESADGALFPNQFVNVRLLVDRLPDVVVVPQAAVQHGPNGTFVYVVENDDTVELRNVTVRATEAGQVAIAAGLSTEEVVVTSGLDRLRPGAAVTTRSAEEKADASAKRR
jgi:multidrug efflux system membrane fusion protein